MGKNYANRKPKDQRPESDYYPTPQSLVWCLFDQEPELFDRSLDIIDPSCGEGAIMKALKRQGFENVYGDDISMGRDFLTNHYQGAYEQAMMNPPFSLFDEFIVKAKEEFPIFASIIKTNFFGAMGRHKRGIWTNLKKVYIFNRQVDYRTPLRSDGQFNVGNLVTGWGIWDCYWDNDYFETRVLDVSSYATLGGFKEQ